MSKLLLFPVRQKVKNPTVVVSKGDAYVTSQVLGDFYLVYPTNSTEIGYLQLLDHQAEKFAPATGNGILIRTSTLP
jgi:hypothetical protein